METMCFLMTTTFYPPYHIGGDAIHVHLLSNELAKRGHEVHVIHLLDSYTFKRGRSHHMGGDKTDESGVIVHSIESPYGVISLAKSYTCGRSDYISRKIDDLIKDISPDVLHHHNIAGFGADILTKIAPRVLYTAHDYWLICPMNDLLFAGRKECFMGSYMCGLCSILRRRPPQFWRLFKNINKMISTIDTIIAPSHFMKRSLIGAGIKRRIEVISNFVVPMNFHYNNIRSCDHIKFDYYLYVGVLEKHKGILELIKLFIENHNSIDSKLVVVGNGSLLDRIKDLIGANNAEDIICIKGKIERNLLSDFYLNAKAVIIPSRCYENNPLVALEAISYGTPLITSDMGGLPEIVRKIDSKLIFHDWNHLTDILRNFRKECYPQSTLIDIYRHYYTIDTFLEKYLNLVVSE